MKRFSLVLVLIFIFGVSCGGIYQLTFGDGKLAAPAFITESIDKLEQSRQEKKQKKEEEKRLEQEILDRINNDNQSETPTPDSKPQETEPEKKSGRVTNPDKICSTEGCGRAVLVEYHGRQLCAKCYSDIKNSEARG